MVDDKIGSSLRPQPNAEPLDTSTLRARWSASLHPRGLRGSEEMEGPPSLGPRGSRRAPTPLSRGTSRSPRKWRDHPRPLTPLRSARLAPQAALIGAYGANPTGRKAASGYCVLGSVTWSRPTLRSRTVRSPVWLPRGPRPWPRAIVSGRLPEQAQGPPLCRSIHRVAEAERRGFSHGS